MPGYAGPLDDLVDRIHRRIEQFAAEAGVERRRRDRAAGRRALPVESLTPEPGYGFVTLVPTRARTGPRR